MLRRIRVGQRLIAGFTLLILAVVAATGVGIWKMSAMHDRANFIADNPLVAIDVLGDLDVNVGHFRVHQLAVAQAADAAARTDNLEETKEHTAKVLEDLKLYAPTIVSAADRAGYEKIGSAFAAYRSATGDLAKLAASGDLTAAQRLMADTQPQFDAVTAAVEEHLTFNRELAHEAVAHTASAFSAARTLLFAFVGLSVLVGIALALLITRSITGPLTQLKERLGQVGDGDLTVRLDVAGRDELTEVGSTFNDFAGRVQDVMRKVAESCRRQVEIAEDMARGAEQTGEAVGQIATTVDEVARGSQEQADSTSRVAATMQEMTEGVQRVSGSGETAAGLAEEADRAANDGARTVGEATEAMRGIERRVADAAEIVVALGERGSQVGQIVDTISDIAEQTNLLALNAAIEAARAGEMGRGFAVVADEVRKLAESTQEQVGSISSIIGEIQQHTERAVEAMAAGREEVTTGVTRVGAAGDAFGTIRGRVEELSAEVMAVAAAAQQLEAGATEVRESLSSVAAVSEENAASVQEVSASTEETSATAEETAASAQQVSDSAQDLARLVSAFTV